MKIAVASDHGGFTLKNELIDFLREQNIEYKDFGAYSTESVDYPDMALPLALAVAAGEYRLGLICCGTGIGISISANKIPGIRAALCHDCFSARMAREHNDANIIAMGERVVGPGLARQILTSFLKAEFAGGRHARRVKKIHDIEQKY